MLQRVQIEGIKLPRIYIAETQQDVSQAQEHGMPYVHWKYGVDEFLKFILRPTLEKKFPGIKWNEVLGRKRTFKPKVNVCSGNGYDPKIEEADLVTNAEEVNIKTNFSAPVHSEFGDIDHDFDGEDSWQMEACPAETERYFSHSGEEVTYDNTYTKQDLFDFMGDLTACVNVEALQKLKLMPQFIGDIVDCIKVNHAAQLHWREGYNKKLRSAVGTYGATPQLPNLIILDISASIPRGISATMLTLIDTLREQVNADLIITAACSRFYPNGTELPLPEELRSIFPLGNESAQFLSILTEHLQGKHYGHVFSFGDNDTPNYKMMEDQPTRYSLLGCRIEKVHHYHTGRFWCGEDEWRRTGYAKWCHMLASQPEVEYDSTWCRVIKEKI